MTAESLLFAVVRASAVIVAWIGTYAIHSTLLLGGAWLATRLFAPDPAFREALWKSALIAALVTPTLRAVPGVRSLGGLYDASGVVERQVWVKAVASTPARSGSGPDEMFDARVQSISERVRLVPVLLATLWALYAAVVFARVLSATERARAALGRRRATEDAGLRDMFARVASRLGLTRKATLTFSPERTSPVALGSTEICLPEQLMSKLTPDDQETILAHEVAHLVRRDPSWLLAAVSLESIFFFQPLNRVARMRIQEEAEYLSDDLAVDRGSSGVALARCLAQVAEWMSSSKDRLMAPALVEERSSLLKRVDRLLGPAPRARRASGARRAAALALPLAVLLVAPAFSSGGSRPWGTPAFQWEEIVAPGKSIEIKGLMGDIRAERSESPRVSVTASRHGRATSPDVRFAVVRHGDGVTICTIYPTPPGVPANSCAPGEAGREYNTRANDVEIDFLVRIPAGVGFAARTATGTIEAEGLTGPIVAGSTSGDIDVSTSSWARAESSAGNVAVRMGSTSWTDTLRIATNSGNIRVWLPPSASAAINAHSSLGAVKSDFNLSGRQLNFFQRLKLRGSLGSWASGVVGQGGRGLDVESVAGNIEISHAR